jgi:hypothetical protein
MTTSLLENQSCDKALKAAESALFLKDWGKHTTNLPLFPLLKPPKKCLGKTGQNRTIYANAPAEKK